MWKEIRIGDISMNSGNFNIVYRITYRDICLLGWWAIVYTWLYTYKYLLALSVEGPRSNDA